MGEGGVFRQNDDGTYSPARPLGWQGHGIDWEVYVNRRPYRAKGYDEDVLVAALRSRTRIVLAWKMRRTEKRFGMRRNGVLR